MVQKLLSTSSKEFQPLQQWDDLPQVVQQYLNQVVPDQSSTTYKALSVQQEGEFLMKKDQYVLFSAKQVFALTGFVWEGKISMASYAPSWFPKLFVSDSWVMNGGVGQFHAAIQAMIPVLCTTSTTDSESEDKITLGQATRWLADAVLLPSTLQPSAGMVTWKPLEQDSAMLELSIASGVQLEATFDSTGLLALVSGSKPFMRSNTDFEMKTWQVYFMDYQRQENGMMVPMKMESGWINEEGDFEAHYKIDNRSLQYIEDGVSQAV